MVKRSFQALVSQKTIADAPKTSATRKTSQPPKIQVQYFTKRKQFKVFVEFSETKPAQQFFSKTYVMKNLAILDDSFKEVFQRDMRVYLVKTEEEFTRFALQKYQEEIKLTKVAKA